MSAIARYFLKKGLVVAGYDKTPSDLTHQLEKEGMMMPANSRRHALSFTHLPYLLIIKNWSSSERTDLRS